MREDIRKLHPETRRKVRAQLDRIAFEPAAGKALRDELAAYRSLRIGRLRVVYREAGSEIHIVGVGPRLTIYQELARRIARDGSRSP